MIKKKVAFYLVVLASYLYSANSIDRVTVTTNKSQQDIDDISRSVWVVDAKTIEHKQSSSLVSLLADAPGLSYTPDGMTSGQVISRGFSSYNWRVPLFIDGNRVRGRNALEYFLIDPSQVERVEIIRGPASAIWGTDSFGGTINVITKKVKGDINSPFALTSDTFVSSEYQSVNHGINSRFQFGAIGDGMDALFGINFKQGSDYETPDGKIANSDYSQKSFDLKLGYHFLDTNRLEFSAKYSNMDAARPGGEIAAPGMGNLDPLFKQKKFRLTQSEKFLALDYTTEINQIELEANLYRREINTVLEIHPDANHKPGIWQNSYAIGPVVWGGRVIGKYSANSLTQTYGIDWYDEDKVPIYQSISGGSKMQNSPSSNQFNIGAFGLLEYTFDNGAILGASLREDYFKAKLGDIDSLAPLFKRFYDDVHSTNTYKTTGGIGLIQPIVGDLDLIANINQSFRMPSFAEIISPFQVPNIDIEPESGIAYEAGVRYLGKNFRSHLTAFSGDYKNLIITKMVMYQGNLEPQKQNAGKARIKGLEFDVAFDILENLKFNTNISYVDGKNRETGKVLSYTMPINGYFRVDYSPEFIKNSYISYDASWALHKTKIDEKDERQRAGYMVSNLYLAKSFGKVALFSDFSINLGIENIFDKKYAMPLTREVISSPISNTNPLLNPGRNLKLGFRAKF